MAKNELPLDGVQDPNNNADKGSINTHAPSSSSIKDNNTDNHVSSSSDKTKMASNFAKDPKGTLMKAGTDKAKTAVKDAASEAMPEEVSKAIDKGVDVANKASTTAATISSIASGVSAFFETAIAILADPIAWIVIAVIIVIVAIVIGIVAAVQLFGRSENADGCSGIGTNGSSGSGILPTSAENADGTVDMMANRDALANWLMTTPFEFLGNKPMTMNQAAAFIGNAYQESKYNPALGQGSEKSDKITNEQLAALGTKGGRAYGIFQWDVEGRLALAHYAQSKGKPWYDFGLQMEYTKDLLDGKNTDDGVNYGKRLLAAGFNDPSKSVDDLTGMVNEYWEISGDRPSICAKNGTCDRNQNRIDEAKKFLTTYSGGQGLTSGGSCLMGPNGGSVNTSNASQLAISMAWPDRQQSLASDVSGKSAAKPEYIQAKQQAMQQFGQDPYLNGELYASCDRFVATVTKLTMDPDIPWGPTSAQQSYLNSSPKWQRYEIKSQAQPGDIWITRNSGHVIMYVGNVNGVDSIAHASFSGSGRGRTAALANSSYLNDNLVDTGGRAYYGYHFVG